MAPFNKILTKAKEAAKGRLDPSRFPLVVKNLSALAKKSRDRLRRRKKLEIMVDKLSKKKNKSESVKLFLLQVKDARKQIRYIDAIAKILEDNSGRQLQMKLDKDGFVKLQKLKPEKGSILEKMNTAPYFYFAMMNYLYNDDGLRRRRKKLCFVVKRLAYNKSESARLFLDQVEKSKKDLRYFDLIAKVVEDNSDCYPTMKLTKNGYIQICILNPESGSILKNMDKSMSLFHHVMLNYRHDKVLPFSKNRGGMTGDHLKGKMRNNPYTQLRLLAHELNLFRKSEDKPEFKQGKKFGLPLHQTIFDIKKKKFRNPFNETMMLRTEAGKYLFKKCLYHEDAGHMSSRTWATTAAAAERRFDRIVKNVCALLIDAIDGEGGDAFCKAMGRGWSHPVARENNLALLRKRMSED